MASVTGPAEVKIREELVDRATLEVNVRPLRGQSGTAAASYLQYQIYVRRSLTV